MSRPTKSRRQQTARQGAVEDYVTRVLTGFNAEVGVKVAQTLHEYHEKHVTPLEERIAALEEWVEGLVVEEVPIEDLAPDEA